VIISSQPTRVLNQKELLEKGPEEEAEKGVSKFLPWGNLRCRRSL
jgi:hypothetical protein